MPPTQEHDERQARWRRAAAEGVGTFFLVLIGPGGVMVNAYTQGALGPTGIALGFAFVVLAMIVALGHISGAHLNPAVTLAFWSLRRFPTRELPSYVAAQCTGAIGAALLLRVLLGTIGEVGATLPHIGIARSFVVEWLLAFVLMLVIMAVATDDRVADGVAALAVGLTVGFCALLGPLTGASMNPARTLGPAVASGLWAGHWLYWVAPITGMLAAARTYDLLRPTRPPAHPPTHPDPAPVVGVQGLVPS
ncbi:MAG: MIP/aquaporin family protein [Gemmatimonadales bacterium]